ncbi:hypothetical protein [Streptomyces sp. NPDC006879]|uniref:hypothetical protein n=1 Tax=Streptomyces sp. NPDC006879 TaxID=3364767 RepID=UPI00367D70F4
MTSAIDQLLSRARLVEHPYPPCDITDRSRSRSARSAAPRARATAPASTVAAQDLRLLCETAVARAAVTSLADFLTDNLPEPAGALVLGCILQLTGAEDSARFWWQYAAGAGDPVASYCLYLHHLALEEGPQARWWYRQTASGAVGRTSAVLPEAPPASRPVSGLVLTGVAAKSLTADASLSTTLRVLRALRINRQQRRRSSPLGAVMDYVAAAVGFVDDDIDLPLPDEGFADHIRALTARACAEARGPQSGPRLEPDLPARPTQGADAAGRPRRRRPSRLPSPIPTVSEDLAIDPAG